MSRDASNNKNAINSRKAIATAGKPATACSKGSRNANNTRNASNCREIINRKLSGTLPIYEHLFEYIGTQFPPTFQFTVWEDGFELSGTKRRPATGRMLAQVWMQARAVTQASL